MLSKHYLKIFAAQKLRNHGQNEILLKFFITVPRSFTHICCIGYESREFMRSNPTLRQPEPLKSYIELLFQKRRQVVQEKIYFQEFF
jgi:hypothetical protein